MTENQLLINIGDCREATDKRQHVLPQLQQGDHLSEKRG